MYFAVRRWSGVWLVQTATMFSHLDTGKKAEFIDKAKAAREERACDKRRDQAAVQIQVIPIIKVF